MRFRAPLVGVAVVAALFVPVASPRAAVANPVSFTHEVTVDPNRMNGEPDVAISDTGTQMFTSGPWGFSTTVSMAWKSEDSGVQWDNLHGSCTANPLRPFCSRGGGDTEVELGTPQGAGNTTQTAYFGDLNGLDSITCAYTTDGGRTFTVTGAGTVAGQACNVLEGQSAPGSDRQWIAVWRAADQPGNATVDKLYMVFDTGDSPPGGDNALMSTDGGHNWVPACTTTTSPSCVGGATGYGSRPGPLLINPHAVNTISTVPYPTLYEFMGTTSTGPEVNISCDGGQSWSHVNIAPTHPGSLTITNDFIVGAMDSAGGLYTAWAEQSANGTDPWRIWYSHSTDSTPASGPGNCLAAQGQTWSTAIPITGPGSTNSAVNYGVMPAIAAGDPGRVDIAYYGDTADSAVNPASANPMTWYLHMSQTLTGTTAQSFTDSLASETPMHVHSICFSGLSCQLQVPAGDRNLADFFEVRPDPVTGRAVILFVDDNNTQPGPPGANPGGGVISSVQQATGPSLYSSVGTVPALATGLSQSQDIRNEVTDPSGDALLPGHQPAPGGNVGAADITDLKITQKDASTLAMTFTVQNMGTGPSTAVVNNAATAAANELHTGAAWLVTWHFNNDLWFASANTDAAGNLTYLAGKPLDVFSSSAPKTLQYELDPQATLNHLVSGSVSGNTVEIDVPVADIGSPAQGSILYGLTGFTADTSAAIQVAGITGGTAPSGASGAAGFLDNIDQTAPIDVSISPQVTTPEVPSLPLLVALGGVAIVAGGWMRRRRRPAA